ncbi:MAG: hypothetical protein JJU03_04505 [Idiomarina sp.]|nr:hypothetical protein [Idiomarina sp.]
MSVFNVFLDFNAESIANPDSHDVIRDMNAASDYWTPEQLSAQDRSAESYFIRMSYLLFSNTLQSKSETVHVSECGDYLCVANARIDNRAELAESLGIHLSTANNNELVADGAIILAAYQAWGEGCAAKLLGDFVFLIWDARLETLYIARDHLGIKTVFYSVGEENVVVSNEHNALLMSGKVSRELSHSYVIDQFLREKQIGYRSPVAAIQRVAPAHYVVIAKDNVRSQCYWELNVKKYSDLHTDDDYLRELRAQFEKAVARRLVTTHPIGSELSEGLDSTAISGLAAKMLPEQTIYTYSYDAQLLTDANRAIYEDTYKDIFDFLELHPNLQAEWTTSDLARNFDDRLEQYYGMPAPAPGQTATRYFLVQEKGVRTLLSGWGGDHCVTSYGAFYEDELFRQGRWCKLRKHLNDMRRRGRNTGGLGVFFKLAAKYLCRPLFNRYSLRRDSMVRLLYFGATFNPLKDELITQQRLQAAKQFALDYPSRGVRERDHRELFGVGVEPRVTGSEIYARAFNFEYRYPMFDKELIEFAYSVPNHLKCKFGIERYMFREVIKDLVTERIRMRAKADVDLPKFDRLDIRERIEVQGAEVTDRMNEPLLKRYLRSDATDMIRKSSNIGHLRGISMLAKLSKAEQEGRLFLNENNKVE